MTLEELSDLPESDFIWLPQPESKYTFFHPTLKHGIPIAKERKKLGKDWVNVHLELNSQRFHMPTIKQFIDFLKLLRSGEVCDLVGQRLSIDEITDIYGKITKRRTPIEDIWLDARFYTVNYRAKRLIIDEEHRGKAQIDLRHLTHLRFISPLESWALGKCIKKESCYIDLLNSKNPHGLPTVKNESDQFRLWPPKKEHTAVFRAGEEVGLYCSYPFYQITDTYTYITRKKN